MFGRPRPGLACRQKLEELTAGLVQALFLSTYETDERSQEDVIPASEHDGRGRHDPLGALPIDSSPSSRSGAAERLAGCVCIGVAAAVAPVHRAIDAALEKYWFGRGMHSRYAMGEILTS